MTIKFKKTIAAAALTLSASTAFAEEATFTEVTRQNIEEISTKICDFDTTKTTFDRQNYCSSYSAAKMIVRGSSLLCHDEFYRVQKNDMLNEYSDDAVINCITARVEEYHNLLQSLYDANNFSRTIGELKIK